MVDSEQVCSFTISISANVQCDSPGKREMLLNSGLSRRRTFAGSKPSTSPARPLRKSASATTSAFHHGSRKSSLAAAHFQHRHNSRMTKELKDRLEQYRLESLPSAPADNSGSDADCEQDPPARNRRPRVKQRISKL